MLRPDSAMPRILMVTPEAGPFIKTGGLGDVMGALPRALVERGADVAVVVPRYRTATIPESTRIWHSMPLWMGPRQFVAAIDQTILNGVRYLFVDCPPLYDRPGIYNEAGVDYPDNHIRFGLLSRAAIEIARYIFKTDVFHAHDWQTGLVPAYLRKFPGDPTFFGAKTVLTIHNLGFQGIFPPTVLAELGLDRSQFHPEGLEYNGWVSLLKAGIVWSDAVTTVSPTYAKEIQTPEYGFGFEGLLRSRASKLTGILNGVDYSDWDPAHDPNIAQQYSIDDLSGKAVCKRALIEEMGLSAGEIGLSPGEVTLPPEEIGLPPEEMGPQPNSGAARSTPLIGIVSRFAQQKGFDLFAEIAPELARENVAFAALGSGEAAIEDAFRDLAAAQPGKFAVQIGFDNGLAHRIEAGADMFLMPSRYEPAGLNQMYSLRYGTPPIVRATGGLMDTVDPETGFIFSGVDPLALLDAIRAALAAYQNEKTWVERVRRGMAKDFSWNASAAKYLDLYRRLISS
jgi:starch synthase